MLFINKTQRASSARRRCASTKLRTRPRLRPPERGGAGAAGRPGGGRGRPLGAEPGGDPPRSRHRGRRRLPVGSAAGRARCGGGVGGRPGPPGSGGRAAPGGSAPGGPARPRPAARQRLPRRRAAPSPSRRLWSQGGSIGTALPRRQPMSPPRCTMALK